MVNKNQVLDIHVLLDVPKHLYHGTAKAFVEYALQNKGKFGPDYASICFTPNILIAERYAKSWQTPEGRRRLENYFEQGLTSDSYKPIILEFDPSKLRDLKYTNYQGVKEFLVEKGPIDISFITKV